MLVVSIGILMVCSLNSDDCDTSSIPGLLWVFNMNRRQRRFMGTNEASASRCLTSRTFFRTVRKAPVKCLHEDVLCLM